MLLGCSGHLLGHSRWLLRLVAGVFWLVARPLLNGCRVFWVAVRILLRGCSVWFQRHCKMFWVVARALLCCS